mmetsp:Transcript_30827/g.65276  ORF Transcript_30827/g.65276 Transcript_30827/m.65276 type:complete len:145 (-) Transcript_30827:612-1046(-)
MASYYVRFHDDLAAAWNLLVEYDSDANGWKLLGEGHGLMKIYHREGPPGMMEINMRVELPFALSVATSFLRTWNLKDPPFCDVFDEFTVLKSFGPGDIICCAQYSKSFAPLMDLLMGLKWPDTLGERLILRMVTRRDWTIQSQG